MTGKQQETEGKHGNARGKHGDGSPASLLLPHLKKAKKHGDGK